MACKTCGSTVAEQRDRKMLQENVNRAPVEMFACQGQILHCTVFLDVKWRNICLQYIPFSTLYKFSSIMGAIL